MRLGLRRLTRLMPEDITEEELDAQLECNPYMTLPAEALQPVRECA